MKIYIYAKCSTCQQALKFLKVNHLQCEIKEIAETPPSLAELKQMLKFQDGKIGKLFNSSGQLYRSLQLKDQLPSMPLDDALQLLTQNGMLVKRPFLLAKTFGLLGFHEDKWEKRLIKEKNVPSS